MGDGHPGRIWQLLNGVLSKPDGDSLITISSFHAKVHGGKSFLTHHLFNAVADAANADLALTTGSGETHTLISLVVEGKCDLFLYEAPTFTVGTSITPVNRNRNSATTALATVVHTPTVTDVGTEIFHGFVAAGGKHDPGSATEGFSEWGLKSSTKYLLRVTNNSGAAIDILSSLHFYEE